MTTMRILTKNKVVDSIKQNNLVKTIVLYGFIFVVSFLFGQIATNIILGSQASISHAKLIGGSFALGGIFLILMSVIMFDPILLLIAMVELIVGIIYLT